MLRVGLIGLGGMGRTHFRCYANTKDAQLTSICDIDERKLAGDWGAISLNIDPSKSDFVDVSAYKKYSDYNALIADPDIDVVDICLPTPLHAAATIAALDAGKHVICEKPMARSVAEARAMEEAKQRSGRELAIAHCLRYWPIYTKTHEILTSGEYGKPLYARFHRSGATPRGGYNDWFAKQSESGGAPLDLHVHDVDAALWWFGKPDSVSADGYRTGDLANSVDTIWRYDNGLVAYLHGSFDNNGGDFRYAFQVTMERGTVLFDSNLGQNLLLYVGGEKTEITVPDENPYQNEIDDFTACIAAGRPIRQVTAADGRLAAETALEELRQIEVR